MNKFETGLVQDAKGIRKQRAAALGKATADAQIDLIRDLEKEKRLLDSKLMDLTDLSPENEYDLRPTAKNFDPTTWVKALQNVKVELLNVEIQLEVANDTFDEWFGDAESD